MTAQMTSTTYDVTYFSHRGARHKTEATIALSDLAEQIRSAQAEAKDLLPWIKLAKFGALITDKGSLRHDANVISVTGVEGDYDGEQISFDDALDTLEKAGVEALLYTSPSHEPDKPRWRVLCPLSAPHAPAERERFMRRLNGLFAGAISDESFTLSQSYYFGHLIECLEYRVEVVDGQCIDLCDELDQMARGKSGIKNGDGRCGQGGNCGERVDIDELIRRIVCGESLHPSVLRIGGSYAARGFPQDACVDVVGVAFTKAGIPRYDGRWDECLQAIDYAYNEEAKKRSQPPPPTASKSTDDIPPPPDKVTNIGPKLKRKGGSAGGGAAPQPLPKPKPQSKPLIPLRAGHLPQTLDAAEAALKLAGFTVLALDTVLVCPLRVRRPASDGREVETTRFIPIPPAQMQRWLAEAADYTKFDKRSNRWVTCDPPLALADALLNTPASWGFPSVIGLLSCPVMRADGTICTTNGYDAATKLYLALDPALVMPDIPENPTREQADAALKLLLDLLDEFCFASDTDRAVALAWLVVPVLRPGMTVAPMFLFTANDSGSGKSYLVDLSAALASGQEAAAVVGAGPNNEETEKRLGALLLEGATHIAVDNVDFDIPGTSIWCHVSERPRLRVRILCKSKTPVIDNAAYLSVTGNNIQPKDDLIRRVLRCTLNVEVEQPEKRKFKKSPVRMVLADRGKYLAAIFTIVRHYQTAGSPDVGDDMWESYDGFVRRVRNPLRYLDNTLDPVKSVDRTREEDPTIGAICELFGHWETLLKADEPVGGYQVYDKATNRDPQTESLCHPEFRDLLYRVAAGRAGKLTPSSVAGWLKRIKGRIVGGKRIVRDTAGDKYHGARYRLETVATK